MAKMCSVPVEPTSSPAGDPAYFHELADSAPFMPDRALEARGGGEAFPPPVPFHWAILVGQGVVEIRTCPARKASRRGGVGPQASDDVGVWGQEGRPAPEAFVGGTSLSARIASSAERKGCVPMPESWAVRS